MGLLRIKPVLQAWGRTLRGRAPSLSIEITKECPLRCPGCYAYEDAHLGTTNLRSLSDFKGQELIARVLDLVDQHRPLHLSIVGGDPLVRYRELEVLLPQLVKRAHIQVVTSAFRPIPLSWATLPNLQLVISVDGLQPEHDVRRQPATYQRILHNIQGHHRIAVHCTITSAMVKRSGYLPEFVDFWSANPAVEKIWMSIFTPQRGAANVECLTADERMSVVETLLRVRRDYPKLDMLEGMIREFLSPPVSPDRCIFAPDNAHALGGFQDARRALPVWRRSRLLAMRLYRFDGAGRGRTSKACRFDHRRAYLLDLSRNWSLRAAWREYVAAPREPHAGRRGFSRRLAYQGSAEGP